MDREELIANLRAAASCPAPDDLKGCAEFLAQAAARELDPEAKNLLATAQERYGQAQKALEALRAAEQLLADALEAGEGT